MQCGIACLGMVCAYFGKNYSLDFLSQYCHATAEGVSLLGISEAARDIGLDTVSSRVTAEHLAESTMPVILHWNQNHFVVLYKVSHHKNFYVADPAKGLLKYNVEELRRHWISAKSGGKEIGVAMSFKPNENFGKLCNTEDAGEKHSVRFLLDYIHRYKQYFFQIILGLLLGCMLQLLMPFLTQAIVDVGIRNGDIDFIWLILLGELLIVTGRTSTDFIRRWLLLHISMRINISLVSDFFIKLLKLPMSFFDTKLLGDIMQRIADHDRVQSFLTTQTMSIMFSSLSFVVFGTVLYIYDHLIFVVFLSFSIIYAVWITLFLKRRKILDYELFERRAVNQNKTFQFVTSMQEIKLQDCERRRLWEWEDVQADLFGVQMKSLKLQQAQEAGSIFVNELKNIIITVLAATSVINGRMSLGMMLAVQYIIGQLNSPIEHIMNFIYSMQDVKISLERINEIHCSGNEEDKNTRLKSYSSNETSIIIENISFKYDPHSLKYTLGNVSLDIPTGKVTAIVGASGSGKSTLIKLMLGYYKVTGGRITIAGRDINEYSMKWWRRHCGVVMQDGVIFSETIARNIAVSDDEIDTVRLERAAQIANIHEYIMELPLRYDTLIGNDGIGLSQGQKQRILIARAVYKDPDYIFLDEATNALDARNERIISGNLEQFYKGRTVVIVAHRLSTVKDADNIVVIDGGHIVESGNHITLIEKRGYYYNLVRNQLELGL
jgi:ATP-binding cassette subfamily B protein